ncbi:hypothetical protein CF137_10350 [Aeromonas sobria]|nr:hypothetical protein CF137_10350 [Aeromonas sobria]
MVFINWIRCIRISNRTLFIYFKIEYSTIIERHIYMQPSIFHHVLKLRIKRLIKSAIIWSP